MNFKRSTYINGATVRGALSKMKKIVKKVKIFWEKMKNSTTEFTEFTEELVTTFYFYFNFNSLYANY